MATGTGKTVVMAMIIAWHSLNSVANPQDRRFTDDFWVVTGHLYMIGIGDDFVVLQLQQESEHSLWVGRLP